MHLCILFTVFMENGPITASKMHEKIVIIQS